MLVWSALRRRGILLAQAASTVCSDVVDSLAFLALAFGSLSLLVGQVGGKEEVTCLSVMTLLVLRMGHYDKLSG